MRNLESESDNNHDESGSSSGRRTFLPFDKPWIDDDDIREVTQILREDRVAVEEKLLALEETFARHVDVTYAVAVVSGSAALHLALEVLGLDAGDEAIVSVYDFHGAAATVSHQRARPVLLDVLPDTLTLDPSLLEEKVTQRTRAIVPVDVGGFPCDVEAILEIAARHSIRVVEDASQALPARRNGRPVGSIGDMAIFDFNAEKPMATTAGGMITTNVRAYADQLRIRRSHGIRGDPWAHYYSAAASTLYEVICPGYNYGMTRASVALAGEHLRKSDLLHAIRTYYAALYQLGLSDLPEVTLPSVPSSLQHAWYAYIIQLNLEMLTIDRDSFVGHLRAANIGASYLTPLHVHPYYRETFGYSMADFPRAMEAYRRVVALPLYPKMTEGDVWDVIGAVRSIVERYSRSMSR